MVQLSGNLVLKIIIGVQYVLSTWASMSNYLLPPAYGYVHVVIIVCGLLCLAFSDNRDLVAMMLVLMVVSIAQDIIFLGYYQPPAHDAVETSKIGQRTKNMFRFSLGMCITNLLLKPLWCFALLVIYRERQGDGNEDTFKIPGLPAFPSFGGSTRPAGGGYQNIDETSRTDTGVETAEHHRSLDPAKPPLDG